MLFREELARETGNDLRRAAAVARLGAEAASRSPRRPWAGRVAGFFARRHEGAVGTSTAPVIRLDAGEATASTERPSEFWLRARAKAIEEFLEGSARR